MSTNRNFSGVNFRRDFAARMSANQHDSSFDTFVAECRRSSEAINVGEGWTQLADTDAFGTPRNPNFYVGNGRWSEIKQYSVLGIPAGFGNPTDPVYVETIKNGAAGTITQQMALLFTGTILRRVGTAAVWGAWAKITGANDAATLGSLGLVRLAGLADIINSVNLDRVPTAAELRGFAGPQFINPVQHGTTNIYDNWVTFAGQAGFTKARAVIGYFEFTDANGGTGQCDAFVRAHPAAVQYQISGHRSGDSSANAHGAMFVTPCADDDGSFQFLVQGGHAYNIRAHGYFY